MQKPSFHEWCFGAMTWSLHWLAGIRLEVRGRENLPDGPFIIAPKHHSWNDGFCMMSQFADLAFVTGNHLKHDKLGAIVVDNCGGSDSRANLSEKSAQARAEGRCILIYPEGHLNRPGQRRRYRAGVWHLSQTLCMDVVPVATNLGCFAPEQDFRKRPGTAVIEFLEPMVPTTDKIAFLKELERRVERQTNILISEATGQPYREATLVPSMVRPARV
jgi:1-acyl-sn-glycerol-3-phosphate acyltransferase